jgi:hypothetical protein
MLSEPPSGLFIHKRFWIMLLLGLALGIISVPRLTALNPSALEQLRVYTYPLWFPPLIMSILVCWGDLIRKHEARERRAASRASYIPIRPDQFCGVTCAMYQLPPCLVSVTRCLNGS